MLFLYQGKSIAYHTPQHLYTNPQNSLIASFFDEFNEFKISEISNSTKFGVLIIYPHEISIVEKSNLKATVRQSFFRGDHYLIQVNYNDRNIYIKHPKEIVTGLGVSLHIDEELIKKRGLKK